MNPQYVFKMIINHLLRTADANLAQRSQQIRYGYKTKPTKKTVDRLAIYFQAHKKRFVC